MPASLAIQQAIYRLLQANSSVRSLIASDGIGGSPTTGAIYDQPAATSSTPESASAFPYIVIGEDTAVDFDADDFNGEETTVTLHIWDRAKGRKKAKQVRDAVKAAMHDCTLDVGATTNFLYCFFEYSDAVSDPDPRTQHLVIRFRIVTMDS